MINWISGRLAGAMVSSGAVRESDREIYEYGLEVLLSTAASVLCVLAVGALIGRILETLAFLAFFIVLRSAAGGFHASTHFRCFLLMMAAYATAMALVFFLPAEASRWAALPVAALSAAVVAAYAPAPHENRPVSDGELRKFRVLSLWLAAAEALCTAAMAIVGLPAIALAAALGMTASAASLMAARRAASGKGQA